MGTINMGVCAVLIALCVRMCAGLVSNQDADAVRTLIILVPYSTYIEPQVEAKLQELECRGFTVQRNQATALDNICSLMATQALKAGWKELVWIDATTDFDVDAVLAVRHCGKAIVGALHPTADGEAFSTHFLPSTTEIKLGKGGGLLEVLHTGMGFLYTKAEVFQTIADQLHLPLCNPGFEDELVPYFKPFVVEKDGSPQYLLYHRAFC